jgi:hypothetical protein
MRRPRSRDPKPNVDSRPILFAAQACAQVPGTLCDGRYVIIVITVSIIERVEDANSYPQHGNKKSIWLCKLSKVVSDGQGDGM